MHPHLALDTLAQVLLFHGPGSEEAATDLARRLGCKPSDIHILRSPHTIAAVRQMIDETLLPPFESPCKIFLIFQSEEMLAPSANALLKTLEEPPSDTYIVLLTSDPDRLLPTVLSRCRPVSFTAPETQKELPFPIEEILKNPAKLDDFEEIDSDSVLEAILIWVRTERPFDLEKAVPLIMECRTAVLHNVKLRHAVEYFLLTTKLTSN
jgi:DNA polymerase III delta prime subunit